jgi:hypothetical protein
MMSLQRTYVVFVAVLGLSHSAIRSVAAGPDARDGLPAAGAGRPVPSRRPGRSRATRSEGGVSGAADLADLRPRARRRCQPRFRAGRQPAAGWWQCVAVSVAVTRKVWACARLQLGGLPAMPTDDEPTGLPSL